MRYPALPAVAGLCALALLAAACDWNERIGEEQSARYAEQAREFAATLPVPPGAELVEEGYGNCAGAYKHEARSACGGGLVYETKEPLIEVMAFYDSYFASEGWEFGNIDSLVSETYQNGEIFIRLGLFAPPLGACPDAAFDPEGYETCVARDIRRDDGKPRTFALSITPDT